MLVSCDDMVRSDAEETLLAEGYKTISVSTIDNALFVLGIYGFSLIILDGAILEIKDYCALKEDYPDVLKIVLVTEGSGKSSQMPIIYKSHSTAGCLLKKSET